MLGTLQSSGTHRILPILTIIGIILLLTSCLDIVQTVESDGNRTFTQIKMSFSKGLIDGAASMSGEEPDYSDLPDFTGEEGLVNSSIPGAEIITTPVDNDADYGVLIEASYTNRDLLAVEPLERPFFPFVDGKRVEILLPPNEDAEEMDEMTAMFFGGSKYRLVIQKDRERREVAEVLIGGVPELASVLETESFALVEIPLSLWMASTDILPVEILFR